MIAVRFLMPESRIWLQYKELKAAGRIVNDTRLPIFDIFRGRLLKITLCGMLWLACYMFSYYAIVVYMPTLTLKLLHLSPSALRSMVIVSDIFTSFAFVGTGWFNDRFGRKKGAVVPTVVWIAVFVGIWIWGLVPYQGELLSWPMFWLNIAFRAGCAALAVSGPWLSELYPIGLRATAVSSVYMAGRAVGSVGPILVPIVASRFGNNLVHGMMVTIPAACIGLLAILLLPETRGRNLAATDTTWPVVEEVPHHQADTLMREAGSTGIAGK
jgi:MFS family permease